VIFWVSSVPSASRTCQPSGLAASFQAGAAITRTPVAVSSALDLGARLGVGAALPGTLEHMACISA
jgi:hypothetical protein